MSPYLIEAEILDRPYNIMLRYTTLIIELNLHPSDTVSAVKNIHYTWFHIILTYGKNYMKCAVLHYIDDAQGFLFFWSLSVVCTGLTLGKYFVHVNICLIAPPETWDVCFQVVVSGLCVQCSYLSGSAVTLAVCILFNLAGFRFIYTTTTKKSREASRHLLTHN